MFILWFLEKGLCRCLWRSHPNMSERVDKKILRETIVTKETNLTGRVVSEVVVLR